MPYGKPYRVPDNPLTGLSTGQGRAPNTVKLRAQYNKYAIAQQESGQEPMSFEAWAKENYPDMKILEQ